MLLAITGYITRMCLKIAILKKNTADKATTKLKKGTEGNHTSHLGQRWPRPPHSEHMMLPVPPQPTGQHL